MRARRSAESGVLRLVAAVLALLLAATLVIGLVGYLRMTSVPDLGPIPRGPVHGASESDLAVFAAGELTPLLRPGGGGHASVTLSEQDLTMEARQRTGAVLGDPQVRVRDGRLVISGRATVLGVAVTAVGHLKVRLAAATDGLPDIGVDIEQIDAGNVTLPGFLRDAIAAEINTQVQLGSLFSANSTLRLLRGQLECVAVGAAGLVLGFHQPLTSGVSSSCQGM